MDYKPSIVHAEETSGRVWRFADFEFDELRRELRVKGRSVELDAKPLEILLQLLLHAGEVVTKEELLESVWPDVMVVDGSLVTAVSKLRKAMGDEDHPAILTVPPLRLSARRTGVLQNRCRPRWPRTRIQTRRSGSGKGPMAAGSPFGAISVH